MAIASVFFACLTFVLPIYAPAAEAAPFDLSIQAYYGDLDDVTAMESYHRQVLDAIRAHQFERLEAEAARCRQSRAVFPNGDPYLFHFYYSLMSMSADSDPKLYDELEEGLTAWVAAMPQSVTALQAFTQFSIRRAEYESAYSGIGSVEYQERGRQRRRMGIDRFIALNAKAWALDQQQGLGDPMVLHYCLISHLNGGGEGIPSREECLRRMALKDDFAIDRRVRLWNASRKGSGGPEEMNALLGELEKRHGPAIHFEAITWLGRQQDKRILEVHPWDLKKVEAGFRQRVAKTRSLSEVGRMAYIAALAEDAALAKQCFGRLGDHFEVDFFASHSDKRIDPRDFLIAAGFDGFGRDNREFALWWHMTKDGKDAKGLKAWNAIEENAVQEAKKAYSTDPAEAVAYLRSYQELPDKAMRRVANAFTSLAYSLPVSGQAAADVEVLRSAAEGRKSAPGLEAWVAAVLDQYNGKDPGELNVRGNNAAYAAVRTIGVPAFVALGPMLVMCESNNSAQWFPGLMEGLRSDLALPGYFEALARNGSPEDRDRLLRAAARLKKELPAESAKLDASLAYLESAGTPGQRLLAARLRQK